MIHRKLIYVFILLLIGYQAYTQKQKFSYSDVFKLEYVSEPQIAPNGSRIVYTRMGFDIMKDKADGNLWMINSDGSGHQKLTYVKTVNKVPDGLQAEIGLHLLAQQLKVLRFICIGWIAVTWQKLVSSHLAQVH